MEEKGWDMIIVSSPHLVQYLTGVGTDIEVGPNPLEGGPRILRIERSGNELNGVLLCPEEVEDEIQTPWVRPLTYVHYDVHTSDYNRQKAYRSALDKWLIKRGSKHRIGMEMGFVPYIVNEFIGSQFIEDCTTAFNQIRRIKDHDEIKQLKAAVHLANIGQRAVKKIAEHNLSEIEMYGFVKAEIEKAAGQRIPLLADFVSGPRTAQIGGPPSNRKIQAGELFLVDLAPSLKGYWGDSCTVSAVGKPQGKVMDVLNLVKESLSLAKDRIRPGVPVSEIDQMVRGFLKNHGYSYPHHTGHGLGLQFHEAPLISANGTDIFEENMVIALEPGVYLEEDGFGIRLEDVGMVTKSGFEQWSNYELDI
jgi:Xaa-Pro dipeptidase